MGGACTGRVQGVRNLPGSYGTGQVGASSACRTRVLPPYTRPFVLTFNAPDHCAAYLHSRVLRELRGLDRRHGVHQTLPG